jgi:hypothetical protein
MHSKTTQDRIQKTKKCTCNHTNTIATQIHKKLRKNIDLSAIQAVFFFFFFPCNDELARKKKKKKRKRKKKRLKNDGSGPFSTIFPAFFRGCTYLLRTRARWCRRECRLRRPRSPSRRRRPGRGPRGRTRKSRRSNRRASIGWVESEAQPIVGKHRNQSKINVF